MEKQQHLVSSSKSHTIDEYNKLKAIAVINIELLFNKWKLEYRKVTDNEFDIISPNRPDKNFGSVRFNVHRGLGADFAGVHYTQNDYSAVSTGFDRSDFDLPKNENIRYGFDIIGLCKLVHGCSTYREAAKILFANLKELQETNKLGGLTLEDIQKKKQQDELKKERKLNFAKTLANNCKSYKGTLGEVYLNSRNIFTSDHEDVMRYHPMMAIKELNRTFPTLLFIIKNTPSGLVEGVHRIYLNKEGTGKADIPNPKKALGTVKGNAIWFGTPCEKLYIVEGPENALSIANSGASFIACCISSGNMHNLTIPRYVKEIILCADRDKAGITAARVALKSYRGSARVSILLPEKHKLANGKFADYNDILRGIKE